MCIFFSRFEHGSVRDVMSRRTCIEFISGYDLAGKDISVYLVKDLRGIHM